MIQFLVSITMTVGGVVLAKKSKDCSGWEIVGVIITAVGGMLLLFCAISLPISRAQGHESVIRFQAFKDSVGRARNNNNLSDIERAAILKEIADWNEWLAAEKYWNVGVWDWWHVDEVMGLDDLQ